jgi:hypothetical protein
MQTDEHGWTALHHSMQATVFWDMAHRVCQGLIEMMDPKWIRMKTWWGKPSGWSALHMACNGKDLMLERGNLVRLLIEHDADIHAVDPQGRTPFLHAVVTGDLDVAEALAAAGCDVWAASYDGRNAADWCSVSSGPMTRCSCEQQSTVLTVAKKCSVVWTEIFRLHLVKTAWSQAYLAACVFVT